MKLPYRQIEGFVRNPDPKARVILVYGPDDGLARERVATMSKSVVEDLNDPFNVTSLQSQDLVDDSARLNDEANAQSMMGGSRLVRIESASDKITPIIKDYLSNPNADNLVILEAGELGPRSSLRKLCESAKNAAAIPCYVEGERDIQQVIQESAREAGWSMERDAVLWLSLNIAGDRMRVRSEIEKLLVFMGEPLDSTSIITLEDVQTICGEAGAQTLEDLIYATAGADREKSTRSFEKLMTEGVSIIMILRALQNHFRKLHLVKSRTQQGESLDSALKSLQPPIFFKYEPLFKAQIQRWSTERLQKTLIRLAQLEAETKQTGMPVETLCAQAILSISMR